MKQLYWSLLTDPVFMFSLACLLPGLLGAAWCLLASRPARAQRARGRLLTRRLQAYNYLTPASTPGGSDRAAADSQTANPKAATVHPDKEAHDEVDIIPVPYGEAVA